MTEYVNQLKLEKYKNQAKIGVSSKYIVKIICEFNKLFNCDLLYINLHLL